MERALEIYNSIDSYLHRGVFISVITILTAKYLFKSKLHTESALTIISTGLIIHCAIYIILFIASLLFRNTDDTFWLRALGPHWWAYWTMMILNSLLPLTLLIRKLRSNSFYLLLISILMNIGWLFESFVIHLTAMERDYAPERFHSEQYNPLLPSSHEISVLVNGFAIGVLLLCITNFINGLRILKKPSKRTLTY